jgi:hypothetical protein
VRDDSEEALNLVQGSCNSAQRSIISLHITLINNIARQISNVTLITVCISVPCCTNQTSPETTDRSP